mmetsp:Transcript_29410/g.91678  ORF Transcript_29410/g.91678 Transcript_29410/m.91678 type:complete len:248 (-) Transcript_29410:46-789(-)
MNYSLRPALASWYSAGEMLVRGLGDEERRADPETWAAKKVQHWFRARRARRQFEMATTSEVMASWLDREDFGLVSEEEAEERRRQRAIDKLRLFVRRWRQRREKRLADGRAPPKRLTTGNAAAEILAGMDQHPMEDLMDPTAIPAQLLRISSGRLKECRVMSLVRRIAREARHTDKEVKPFAHRLVTLNWLEDIADLDLVQDRHWEAWAVPEKVVIEVKAAVRGYMDDRFQSGMMRWFGYGSSCGAS